MISTATIETHDFAGILAVNFQAAANRSRLIVSSRDQLSPILRTMLRNAQVDIERSGATGTLAPGTQAINENPRFDGKVEYNGSGKPLASKNLSKN